MNVSKVFLKRPLFPKSRCTRAILSRKLYSTEPETKIVLPKRIPRGPTDILRALESTISRDPTAAHYKYHDDPYLIPKSSMEKRTYAMAQESGKKAAHWVRQQNAKLFNHREADPDIEAFFPRTIYNDKSEVTEEDLKKSIDAVQVSDAQVVYRLLKEKGVEISAENAQAFLELVCYFNSEDTLSEEFIEERWFRQSSTTRERQRKTWQDGHLAEELFISVDNPPAEMYSAIIQGMAKYYQIDRAWQLFEEAQKKNFTLPVETYNSLFKVVNFLRESFDLRWSLIENLLGDMNKMGVRPNLATLNSILYSMSTMGSGRIVKDGVLKVLREFKDLGIEPSLGTWYYVLITYCKERGPVSTILHDIMRQVENRTHQIQDLADTNFFVTAMDICRNHLNDLDLARRVDQLLHVGHNYDLIGDSYKESIYYRNYFFLLVNNVPFEDFMAQTYDTLVPNIYVPEPSVIKEMLNQVELNGAVEHIPRLWSDIIIFGQANRENLVNSVLSIMEDNQPQEGSKWNERFSEIAWDMYSRIQGQDERRTTKVILTGDLLGKMMILSLRNNNFDRACTLMDKLNKEQSSIVGVPKFEALSLFVDHCIENKMPSRAVACIQYCSDSGFEEVTLLAANLNEKLTLEEDHLNALSKIVGTVDFTSNINVGI